MKTKHINTLAELRQAKKALKEKMEVADLEVQDNFLYNTATKLFSSIENNSFINDSPIGSGVNNVLNFITTQAGTRLNFGKAGKTILSVAVIVAAPIIAKKVQEFIDDRL